MAPKIKAKKESGLIYLRDMLEKTLQYTRLAYEKYRIPTAFLPSAGREIAITPLFVAAAYESNFVATTEIQVSRKSGLSKGRLDLALFSKRDGRRADLLELKATRYIISTDVEVGLKKLRDSIQSAKDQLDDIDYDEIEIQDPGRVAVVIQNIICLSSITNGEKWEDKEDEYHQKADILYKKVTKETPDSLVGLIKWPSPHKVNASHDKYSSIGLLVVLQRV
ncbi:hypothetical protein [Aliamphritea hakodatensis]|uniref:hypothetical protein n=1 Tax=Aliamphritea hakodatensis TaxID=2895352 RepID=UPI0022FD73A8|nr:hypothetical protein [Aliamphritea hakodatensis]